jgi:hypothetical protein
MKWCVGLLAVTAMLAGMLWAEDEEQEKPAPSVWMRKKMEYSQKLLEGLAVGDFELLSQQARAMNALNQIEGWVRGKTPDYRTQLRIFRFANEELIRQADEENLDGASLAFVQLTLSCVNCHKLVRGDRRPAGKDAAPAEPAAPADDGQ